MKLTDRVILITGGTDGIGAACARVLQSRGAHVYVCGLPHDGQVVDVNGAHVLYGDITLPEFRRQFVAQAVRDHGRIDILINCAGVGLYAPASETTVARAREVFEVNFFAAFEMVNLVLPHLGRHGSAAVVNMGSIGGRVALPWSPFYCASKYALHALSEALYRELRHQNIHVMTVVAGIVRTHFRRHVLGGAPPPSVERMRMMAPDTLARAIVAGLERRQRFVVKPWIGHAFDFLNRWFPFLIDAYCDRKYREPLAARRTSQA